VLTCRRYITVCTARPKREGARKGSASVGKTVSNDADHQLLVFVQRIASKTEPQSPRCSGSVRLQPIWGSGGKSWPLSGERGVHVRTRPPNPGGIISSDISDHFRSLHRIMTRCPVGLYYQLETILRARGLGELVISCGFWHAKAIECARPAVRPGAHHPLSASRRAVCM
jgi:hypothetical protein